MGNILSRDRRGWDCDKSSALNIKQLSSNIQLPEITMNAYETNHECDEQHEYELLSIFSTNPDPQNDVVIAGDSGKLCGEFEPHYKPLPSIPRRINNNNNDSTNNGAEPLSHFDALETTSSKMAITAAAAEFVESYCTSAAPSVLRSNRLSIYPPSKTTRMASAPIDSAVSNSQLGSSAENINDANDLINVHHMKDGANVVEEEYYSTTFQSPPRKGVFSSRTFDRAVSMPKLFGSTGNINSIMTENKNYKNACSETNCTKSMSDLAFDRRERENRTQIELHKLQIELNKSQIELNKSQIYVKAFEQARYVQHHKESNERETKRGSDKFRISNLLRKKKRKDNITVYHLYGTYNFGPRASFGDNTQIGKDITIGPMNKGDDNYTKIDTVAVDMSNTNHYVRDPSEIYDFDYEIVPEPDEDNSGAGLTRVCTIAT